MGTDALIVLAIDDNRDNLTVLKAILSDAFPQAQVLTATTGKRGLELAHANDPDVILLDIVMPGMDGFEVCRILKQDERLQDIPVVFITAQKTDKESRIRALETGAEAFLSKPVDEIELIAEVRAMAKIREANKSRLREREELSSLIEQRTGELRQELRERYKIEAALQQTNEKLKHSQTAMLNLLEDQRTQIKAREKSEEGFRSLFENMTEGVALHELVLNQKGEPVNYRILNINPRCETVLGFTRRNVIGRLATEVYGAAPPYLMEYSNVALKRTTMHFETYYPPMEKFFSISAVPWGECGFATIFSDITERTRADQALRESEGMYRLLAENVADVVWTMTADGKFSYVSPSVEKLRGYTPEEVLRQTVEEALTPASLSIVKTATRETAPLFHNGPLDLEPRTFELEQPCKDGSTVWTEARVRMLFDQNGALSGYIGVSRDIRERMLAEAAIRRRDNIMQATTMAAEEFLRSEDWQDHIPEVLAKLGVAADVSRVYIFENHTDENGVLRANQIHEWAAPGITPQIDNPDLQNFSLHETGLAFWEESLSRGSIIAVAVKEFPEGARERLVAQDILSLLTVPIFVESEWWGFMGFDSCLSEREWSELEINAVYSIADLFGAAVQRNRNLQQLQEKEEKYRQLIENAYEAIYVVQDGAIQFANEAASRLVDKALNDLIGSSILDFTPEEQRSEVELHHSRFIRGEISSSQKEYTILQADGTLRHALVNAVRILWNERPATLNFASDITDRKRAEEELALSRQKLTLHVMQTPLAVIEFDLSGYVTEWNPAAANMFGYAAEDAIGRHWSFIVPEDAREQLDTVWADIVDEADANRSINENRTQTGERIICDWVNTPLVDPDGCVIGVASLVMNITERKTAEAQLIESERKYRQLTELMPNGILIHIDGIIVYANSAAGHILGPVSSQNLIGKKLLDFVHPAYRDIVIERISEITGEQADVPLIDEKLIRLDGTELDAEVKAIPFKYMGRTAVQVVFGDVTQKKKAITALAESEATFRSIAEQSSEMIYLTDEQGRVSYVSPKSEELFRRQPEEMIGKPFTEFLCASDIPPASEAFKRTLEKNQNAKNLEFQMRRYDGTTFIGELSGSLYQRGDKRGTVGVIRDITFRKTAEDAIRMEKRRLEDALIAGNIALWEWNIGSGAIEWSDVVDPTAILGLEDFPKTIDAWTGLLHPEDTDRVMLALQNHLQEKHPYEIDYRLRKTDGDYMWCHVMGTTRKDTDGDAVFMSGATVNITERKLAEESIQKLLAEKELLLREVHHRIKNNMNSIIGLLTIHSEKLDNPEAIAALQSAKSRVLSMLVLYDKLYRSQEFRTVSTSGYLASLVDEIIAIFPNKASVQIVKEIDEFILDTKKLFPLGILINELLTNAMKHAFEGRDSGVIFVSASMADRATRIIIRDNGKGLPESFEAAKPAGFGLQLVNMLARQIRATVQIENVGGVQFIIDIQA
jgi:PAS domain S-box-containing protein